MNALHWTFPLIGLPWRRGAQGPDAFDCWGIVRHAVYLQLNQTLPLISIGAADNLPSLAHAARDWHPAEEPMREHDIVLMQGPHGRHVGFVVSVISGGKHVLRLLHSNGFMSPSGPKGGVVLQRMSDVACDGYSQFELWRCVK